jgi:hypothetical protein
MIASSRHFASPRHPAILIEEQLCQREGDRFHCHSSQFPLPAREVYVGLAQTNFLGVVGSQVR